MPPGLRGKQLEQAAAPGRDEVAKKLFRLLCQEETVKMTFGEPVGAWEIFMGWRRTEPLLQEIAGHVQRLAGQSPVLSQAFYEVLAGLQQPGNDAAHPRRVIVAYQQAREKYARYVEGPLAPNALPPIPAVADSRCRRRRQRIALVDVALQAQKAPWDCDSHPFCLQQVAIVIIAH